MRRDPCNVELPAGHLFFKPLPKRCGLHQPSCSDHGRSREDNVAGGPEAPRLCDLSHWRGGDYVKGVVALVKSLRAVRSSYPLIVAVTDCVPGAHRKLLLREGCIVREIEKVEPLKSAGNVKFACDYYVVNYTKLRIWQFGEYDKLIYLDADMLLFQNIDELFDSPPGTFSAVMDCFCESTWSHTVQYQLGYCQQAPHKMPWTADAPKPAPYFNADMFVFQPSSAIFKDMLQKVEEWPPTPFAEQDFLNRYFQAVYRPLPNCYNLVLAMLWRHPENVDVKKVKNVHYCAKGSKPWKSDPAAPYMDHPTVKDFVAQWEKLYNSESRAGQADVSLQARKAAALSESNMPTSADVQQKLLPKRTMAQMPRPHRESINALRMSARE